MEKIYITGSKNDPCSNSLIEALRYNLHSVVLNDDGIQKQSKMDVKNSIHLKNALRILTF